MPYSTPILSVMVDDLAGSLGDPLKVFWLQDELERLCREALRTWSCYASYWRNRRQFATAAGNHFYNLSALGLTVQASDILSLTNDLQYALVEPFSTPSPPYDIFTTTAQYSSQQINSALLQALRQFQFDSGMVPAQETLLNLPHSPAYILEMIEQVVDVRHVNVIVEAPGDLLDNRIYHLRRIDEADVQRFSTFDLLDSNLPYGYSFLFPATQPSLRLIPPPSVNGKVEIISIRSNSLPPVDYQWPVKWLALHYLLTMDGQSRDHQRAVYCRKRYEDAIKLAALVPSISVGYINNRPASIIPVSDMDSFEPGWRNLTLAAGNEPTVIVNYGWNLVGVHPTPSIASPIHSISFDMITEGPVTVDPLQIAPEHLQSVLDYAKHIAIWKLGGAEFTATIPLMERFFEAASRYNSKLQAESKNFWTMRDREARDKQQRYERRAQPSASEQLAQIADGGV